MKFQQISLCTTLISTVIATATSTPRQVPEISNDSFLYPNQDKEFMETRNRFYHIALENAKEVFGMEDGEELEYPNQLGFRNVVEVLIVNYYNITRKSNQCDIIQIMQDLSLKTKWEFTSMLLTSISKECDLSFVKLRKIPIDVLEILNPETIYLIETGLSDGLEGLADIRRLTTVYLDNNKFKSLAELNKLSSRVTTVSIVGNPLNQCPEGSLNKNNTIKCIILSSIEDTSDEFMCKIKQKFETVKIIDPVKQIETPSAAEHVRSEQIKSLVQENCAKAMLNKLTTRNNSPALLCRSELGSFEYRTLMKNILHLQRLQRMIRLSLAEAVEQMSTFESPSTNILQSNNVPSANPSTAELLNDMVSKIKKIEICLNAARHMYDVQYADVLNTKAMIDAASLSNAAESANLRIRMKETEEILDTAKYTINNVMNGFLMRKLIVDVQRIRLSNVNGNH